jgi:hypothetical protein
MSVTRAQEVDLLRTVALVGICLVNMPYLALPQARPPEPQHRYLPPLVSPDRNHRPPLAATLPGLPASPRLEKGPCGMGPPGEG